MVVPAGIKNTAYCESCLRVVCELGCEPVGVDMFVESCLVLLKSARVRQHVSMLSSDLGMEVDSMHA